MARRRRRSRRSRSLAGFGAMPLHLDRYLPRGSVGGIKWAHVALGAVAFFAWKNRAQIETKVKQVTSKVTGYVFAPPQAAIPGSIVQSEVAVAGLGALDFSFGKMVKKAVGVAQKAVAAPVRPLIQAAQPNMMWAGGSPGFYNTTSPGIIGKLVGTGIKLTPPKPAAKPLPFGLAKKQSVFSMIKGRR